MFKQFTLVALLASSAFTAQTVFARMEVYGGLGLGIDHFAPDRRVEDFADPLLATIVKKNQDYGNGALGNILFGIKHSNPQWSIAAEFADQFTDTETEAKIENFQGNVGVTAIAKIRHSNTYSFSILPGFAINPSTELFFRAGYARGRFQVKSGGDTGGDLIATDSETSWRNGYVVGVGLDSLVMCNVSARLEYNYSRFKSITTQSVLPPIYSGDTITSRIKPQDHAVTLSIIFHSLFGTGN